MEVWICIPFLPIYQSQVLSIYIVDPDPAILLNAVPDPDTDPALNFLNLNSHMKGFLELKNTKKINQNFKTMELVQVYLNMFKKITITTVPIYLYLFYFPIKFSPPGSVSAN